MVYPKLADWSFSPWGKILSLGKIGSTFGKILVWNILWAVLSTALNFVLGLGMALLLNKRNVRGSKFWRAFPILAYAIPGFITMIGFKFMFSQSGPINYYLEQAGHMRIFFLTNDASAKWWARGIGLFVNAWITTPSIMLMTTGILSNINTDLYEAASLDGASAFMQFRKITLRDGVQFSSGRTMDAQAVKECLEDLISVHDRAPGDMKIDSIGADGMTVTIHTSEPCPAEDVRAKTAGR